MKKWLPLLAVCMGSFLFLLDTTVVVVAGPRIATELGGRPSSAAWVLNAYTLVLAMLMLPAGGWADRLGHRRVFSGGLIGFAAASLGCAIAPTMEALLVCRALQGVGGAAIAVAGFSLLVRSYPDVEARGRALGIFFAVNGLGAAVGPLAGGLLTASLGWRAIFMINLPLALGTAGLVLKATPPDRGCAGHTDWPGVVLFAVSAGGLTFGLSVASGAQPSLGAVVVSLIVAVVAFAGFLLVEWRTSTPLLQVRLFGRPAFGAVMLAAGASSLPFAALVYTSIWLQDVDHLGPLQTGVTLLPLAATVCLVSTLAGGRLHSIAPGLPLGTGLVVIAVGALLQSLPWATTPCRLIPGLLVTGIGVGLIGPTLGNAVAVATPPRDVGMGAGAMTTTRQLGQTVAVAALALPFAQPGGGIADKLHAVQQPVAVAALLTGLTALALLPRPAKL